MPASSTSCMRAPAGSFCWQASRCTASPSRLAISFQPTAAITSVRSLPASSRTGMRSPRPSAWHHACSRIDPAVAAPLKRSTKTWSSSTCPPDGRAETTVGPPVSNRYSGLPV
ncbi:hypothetical protein D3C81_1205290 [compost metagenome]